MLDATCNKITEPYGCLHPNGSISLPPGEEDVASLSRGVQREAQLERGCRLQGAGRHPRHDRQRPGHRRGPARDQEEALPHVLIT